jgi:hypothetical protein
MDAKNDKTIDGLVTALVKDFCDLYDSGFDVSWPQVHGQRKTKAVAGCACSCAFTILLVYIFGHI